MMVDVNGSRGSARFAYQFDPEMKAYNRQHAWSYQLAERVNLRIALMASGELTYPPRVRQYLLGEMLNNTHYVRGGSPAIAFSFGWKTAQSWFVYVMQSDLASCAPAHVRGHFRGWRKALFASIATHALGKASAVYLCRSEDVVRACYPGSARPGRIPDAWKSIYDRTAAEFGMPLVQLSEPIDLQMYRRRAPVYATWFYELQLPEWKSGLMRPKEAAEWPVTP
jgi:hypothetical protein